MKRLELRRVATLWDCDADFEVTGPQTAQMWEPLEAQAPLAAKPYTCYADMVIFYRDDVGRDEMARCRHLDLNTPSPTLVFLGGRWWEVGGGTVVQRDGHWCMRWNLYSNTVRACEQNYGEKYDPQRELAWTRR